MAEKDAEYTKLQITGNQKDGYAIWRDKDVGLLSLTAHCYDHKEYARLICAAVNACISINKENPLAVAEGMENLVKVAKQYEATNDDLMFALASIERGK